MKIDFLTYRERRGRFVLRFFIEFGGTCFFVYKVIVFFERVGVFVYMIVIIEYVVFSCKNFFLE